MKPEFVAVILAVAALLAVAGCNSDEVEADLTLVVISAHNEDTKLEFARAFKAYHSEKFGKTAAIEWRDVGGGGNKILTNLRNVYSHSETAGIDVVWGGGHAPIVALASEGLLTPLEVMDDVKRNVPAKLCGVPLYDSEHLWCGTAVSGFGFIYNTTILKSQNVAPPTTWDDLGSKRFKGLVALADPTQSSSAASAYEIIIQSGRSWPQGWAKLLGILGNANKFYSGAGEAANAVTNQVAVATCIDFYGYERVAANPDELVYVNPRGQKAFTPDCIAVLKNPPNNELAQRFVAFVMSRKGQALWALPVGAADGPAEKVLLRQPVRTDVYTHYAGKLAGGMTSPYAGVEGVQLDTAMWQRRSDVLKKLVAAAAVNNAPGLKAAKQKLIETDFDAARLAEFNALPPNVARADQIAGVARDLHDDVKAERIIADWRTFFRDKYVKVAR